MTQTDTKAASEHAMQWALEDILTHQKSPSQEVISLLPDGEMSTIIAELVKSLCDGETVTKRSFLTLSRLHPWLTALRSKEIPPRPGEQSSDQDQKSTRRIRFVEDDVIENMPIRKWLIAGILPQSGIAMLFGPPGTYKSFLAIDWALSIGYGRGWLGRDVQNGSVAYVAGEGAYGLGPRIKAWKGHNQKQGKSGVRWYGDPIALTDPASVAELMIALDEDFPDKPSLLIIDTLSRNSGGADENSNTEMAKIINSADQLQQRYGCSVLIVHHAGKDKGKGPRGASSLIGNMETIISTDLANDGVKVECYKQKDAAHFDPITLDIQTVHYGHLDEGASLVLVKSELVIDETEAVISTKRTVQIMYDVLAGKELTSTNWVNAGIEAGISESAAKKARKELYDGGRVWYKKEGKLYYLPTKNDSPSGMAESEVDND